MPPIICLLLAFSLTVLMALLFVAIRDRIKGVSGDQSARDNPFIVPFQFVIAMWIIIGLTALLIELTN